MNITLERTRLIFSEYDDVEKKRIEDLVATMDKVFTYEDVDNHKIYLPPGMKDPIHKAFPKISIVDKLSEYWDFSHIAPVEHSAEPRNQLQQDFIKYALDRFREKKNVAGILSPGTGKQEPVSRRIPTPNGYTRMGDLKIGDKIFGSNGKQITVTGVFDQGEQDVYKVTFNDGRYALCGKDHLWNVMYSWTNRQTTIPLKDMLDDYKIFSPYKENDNQKTGSNRDPYLYKYRIPILSSPVQYDSTHVPIHPYVLGAFIGNGCCTEYALSLSSGNDFVPNKIADICGFTTKKSKHTYTYHFYDRETGKRISTKDFFRELSEVTNAYSRDKIIPDQYIYNDVSVRMELLRGLMDTDGCIRSTDGLRYHVSYSSCSKKLLEQIQELTRGLGFDATIMQDSRTFEKYVKGYHGELLIRVPQEFKQELFTLPAKLYQAKKAANIPDRQQPFRYLIIKDIQLIKREESRCIAVDAEDELYLTEQFIVTHNTFMACYIAIKVGYRTLIIAPTTSIKDQWAETLIKMFKVPPEKVVNVRSPKDFINVKADFVVVSHASLASINKNYDLERIMKANKFGFKVVDEVQMWFHNLIKIDGSSNICLNLYLTGTFGRSGDEENRIYQQMFGDLNIFREKDKKPTIFDRKPGNVYGMKPHMHVKMIWTRSGLDKEQIKKVCSTMRYSERSDTWMRMGINVPAYTELIIPSDGTVTRFLKKIIQVIQLAENEVDYGRTLILTSTIDSVEILADYVRKLFPNKKLGTIHSRNQKADNIKNKAECDIMISTCQTAGTGFDAPGLSKLVVIQPFKSWILADQVSGRLRRRPDGKDTYMYDIVDSEIKQLRAWANVRANILKRKGKTFKVVDL